MGPTAVAHLVGGYCYDGPQYERASYLLGAQLGDNTVTQDSMPTRP
jgi:hypothetical protein